MVYCEATNSALVWSLHIAMLKMVSECKMLRKRREKISSLFSEKKHYAETEGTIASYNMLDAHFSVLLIHKKNDTRVGSSQCSVEISLNA